MHYSTTLALLLPTLYLRRASADVVTAPNYEVDLIYPRSNTTISNTQPVPIVFAIQNPLVPINLLDGQIVWNLYPIGSEGNLSAPGAGSDLINIGSFFNWSTPTTQPPPSPYQPFYFQIDSLSNFVGIDGHWVFIWSVKGRNYTGSDYKNSNDNAVVRTNKLFFTTERNAPTPDLVAATANDTCNSTESATFFIEGYQNDTLQTPWNVVAILGNETLPATPCEVRINATQADEIAAQITAEYCSASGYNISKLNISCAGYPRSAALRGLDRRWSALTGSVLAAALGAVLML